jgi:hypothetical protein
MADSSVEKVKIKGEAPGEGSALVREGKVG